MKKINNIDIRKTAEKQITRGIRKTRELKFYLFNFALRITLFLIIFFFYLRDRAKFEYYMSKPFWMDFSLIHVIWAVFMLIMIRHLIPNNKLTMAWQKARENYYRPDSEHDELELLKFVQTQNIRAWRVMLVWLSFNAIFGVLYLLHFISSSDLLMLSVFYFLCDYICILIFCPFQTGIMKNKCCINCRIYDWGHFMMFTPMLFIRQFYSWSLFFTSLVVLIHWEISYNKHPERFWEGSNMTLRCENCKERTCTIKKTATKLYSDRKSRV